MILLVDIKRDGAAAYKVLHELLLRYAEWFDDLRVARQEDWVRIEGLRR